MPFLSIPIMMVWDKFGGSLSSSVSIYHTILWVLFLLPLAFALYTYLEVRSHDYTLTNQRFQEEWGLFTTYTNELELYRVKDISAIRPLIYRLSGLGSLLIHTSDHSNPIVIIDAIPRTAEVMSLLRTCVEEMRRIKAVREFD